MTQATQRLLTLQDYLAFSDDTDTRYELIDGLMVNIKDTVVTGEMPMQSTVISTWAMTPDQVFDPPE